MLGHPPYPAEATFGLGVGTPLDLRSQGLEVTRKFRQLEDAWRESRMALALRWFGKGSHDHRDEDGLLAQMVALEALVLGDLDKRDRGELSFRIALRVARYLDRTIEERRTVYKLVRRAYDLRSQLLHAGEPAPSDGEEPATVPLVRSEVDSLVRRLFWRWFDSPPDWTSVQLG